MKSDGRANLHKLNDDLDKYSDHIQVFNDCVKIYLGPMNLTIVANRNGKLLEKTAVKGAKLAIRLLDQISHCRNDLKRSAFDIKNTYVFPEVVQRMISTCRLTKDRSLTPMGAVSGTISDLVAEAMETAGATKIVVENGGDIAIKLKGDEVAKVGIVPRIGDHLYSHVITANARNKIGGVSSSGLGGMGFTKGVASCAVAISSNAALADACGKMIGNSTVFDSEKIVCRYAEELDPDTDIIGHRVTYSVGQLTREEVDQALQNGLKKAAKLVKMGLLVGTIIFVQGQSLMIPTDIARPVVHTQPSL